jgi:hypothetical protein
MFVASLAVGAALFRLLGLALVYLWVALLPHVVMVLLVTGDALFHPFGVFSLVLTVISTSAIPAGLFAAWLFLRGRAPAVPSGGRPPAGFAA